MIEVFIGDRVHLGGHPRPQRVRQVDLFAGNRDLHRNLPSSSTGRPGSSMAGVPAATAFGHAVDGNVHYGKAQRG
jgi:hypothetical protein